ncbi:hypothetical protein D3C72_2018350 [compost metagenome]
MQDPCHLIGTVRLMAILPRHCGAAGDTAQFCYGLFTPEMNFVAKTSAVLFTIMHQDLHQNESILASKH